MARKSLGVGISWRKDKNGSYYMIVEQQGVQTLLLVLIPIVALIIAFYLRRYRPQYLSFGDLKAEKGEDQYGRRRRKIKPNLEILPNIFAAFIVVGGWVFTPGFFAEMLVMEREKRIRNLMTIVGLNPLAYWVGQACADAIFWLIPMLVSFLIIPIMDSSNAVLDEWTKPGFYCSSILFGLELQAFSYFYSFGFQTSGSATAASPIVILALIISPLFLLSLIVAMQQMVDSSEVSIVTLVSLLMYTSAIFSPHGAFLAAVIQTIWPHELANFVGWKERCRYEHGEGLRKWFEGDFNRTFMEAGIPQKCGGEGSGPGYFNTTRVAIMSEEYTPIWGIMVIQICKIAFFWLATIYVDAHELRAQKVPPVVPTSDDDLADLDRDVREENRRVNRPSSEEVTPEAAAGQGIQSSSSFPTLLGANVEHSSELEMGTLKPVLQKRPSGIFWDRNDAETADPIVLRNLRKVYRAPTKSGVHVAVHDMNFGVHLGECFGLLGANGAGKSTTVAMLTRHTIATRGEATVNGHSVNTAFTKAATSLGVVTQDNTLYDELSAQEHLELFCKIKGVLPEQLDETVQDALRLMELGPHSLKQSERLSGGKAHFHIKECINGIEVLLTNVYVFNPRRPLL